jgi:hypothetical protein
MFTPANFNDAKPIIDSPRMRPHAADRSSERTVSDHSGHAVHRGENQRHYARRGEINASRSPENHAIGNCRTASDRAARRERP